MSGSNNGMLSLCEIHNVYPGCVQFSDIQHVNMLMGWAPDGTSIATLGSFPRYDVDGKPNPDSKICLYVCHAHIASTAHTHVAVKS